MENLKALIAEAFDENPHSMKQYFHAEISEKIREIIESKKAEIAEGLFVDPTDDEDLDESKKEDDDYEDEDEDEEDDSINEIAYEKDLDHNKPIVVHGVKGLKSKPFRKKFRDMSKFEKWSDSDAADDHEIHRIMNEEEEVEELDEVSMAQKRGNERMRQMLKSKREREKEDEKKAWAQHADEAGSAKSKVSKK